MRARTRAALAALSLAGCASTPTGDWDMAVVSQSQLERGSAQAAIAIDGNLVLVDGTLTEYLSALGARIAAHSAEPDRAFSFKILKTREPAGFTLPGGQVYLSRGLLALATSEDELAWVLGHEIGHVTARHGRSSASKARLIGFITSIVTAPLLDPTQMLANAMPGLITPSFSRGEELEADDLGAVMVREAGFDPACGARMLLAFHGYDELMAHPDGGGLFDTHPHSKDRYERLVDADERVRAPSCDHAYETRIVGLRLDANDGSYGDAAGDMILPSVGLTVQRGVKDGLKASFPLTARAVIRDPKSEVWLRVEEQAGGLTAARMHAQPTELDKHFEQLVLDEPPSAGRPTVRWIVLHEVAHRDRCEYRQWVEDGERTLLVYSEYPEGDREEVEPALAALIDRIQVVSLEKVDELPIVPRIALHTVAEGETLESVAKRYAMWSPELLAVYNDLASDAVLAPGQQLKVAEWQPLEPPSP